MHRADDKNIEVTTEGENDFKAIVGKLFEPGNYIIQQGLELISFKGGIVDFRCAMQKNEAFEWVCNGIFARTGAKESIVSNISDGGTALPSLELMKEIFNLSEIEAFNMKNSIISVCSKACMALDEYGLNLGTLGLDIGIDKNRNIWLIEINNRRPHPRIALRANDIQSYYAIMSGPMHYAKALAGFRYKEVDDHVL
jgi:glutathione synthase/RimK-type ligase-like ATP-grasp enzyme